VCLAASSPSPLAGRGQGWGAPRKQTSGRTRGGQCGCVTSRPQSLGLPPPILPRKGGGAGQWVTQGRASNSDQTPFPCVRNAMRAGLAESYARMARAGEAGSHRRGRPFALMVSLSNHEGGAERLWPTVRQAHHEAEDLERESWLSAHNASRTDFAGDRHESYPRMVRARGEDREEAPFIPEISNTGPSPFPAANPLQTARIPGDLLTVETLRFCNRHGFAVLLHGQGNWFTPRPNLPLTSHPTPPLFLPISRVLGRQGVHI